MTHRLISIYITCADEDEAMALSMALLEEELVACANCFPIDSSYWWEGRIQSESEYAIVAKSIDSKWEAIKELVENKHSYDVPCIIKHRVEANAAYYDWVLESVGLELEEQ